MARPGRSDITCNCDSYQTDSLKHLQDILRLIQEKPRKCESTHPSPWNNVLSSLINTRFTNRSPFLEGPPKQRTDASLSLQDLIRSTPRPAHEYPLAVPTSNAAHFVPRLGGGSAGLSLRNRPADMPASQLPLDELNHKAQPPLSKEASSQVRLTIQPLFKCSSSACYSKRSPSISELTPHFPTRSCLPTDINPPCPADTPPHPAAPSIIPRNPARGQPGGPCCAVGRSPPRACTRSATRGTFPASSRATSTAPPGGTSSPPAPPPPPRTTFSGSAPPRRRGRTPRRRRSQAEGGQRPLLAVSHRPWIRVRAAAVWELGQPGRLRSSPPGPARPSWSPISFLAPGNLRAQEACLFLIMIRRMVYSSQ
jgi:hypothetical protein